MPRTSSPHHPCRRLTPLAAALALGLGTAVPGHAATVQVQNCNDNGTGSLRWAVGLAQSGDTVDLRYLSCTPIALTSSVVTSVDDLTILGLATPFGPMPIIDAPSDGTALVHQGTGTLTLNGVYLVNGSSQSGDGGCVSTSGNLVMNQATLKKCNVTNSLGGNVRGGGAFVAGNATITNSDIVQNKATTVDPGADAMGGGLFVGGNLTLLPGQGGLTPKVVIEGNQATAGKSTAQGGGIHVGGTLITKGSIIKQNVAKSDVNDGTSIGGGGYVGGNITSPGGGTTTIENSEIRNNSAEGKYAYGGGLSVAGNAVITGSIISGNASDGWAGGLIAYDALGMDRATISGNDAAIAGGLIALDNVDIHASTISGNTADDIAGAYLGLYASQPVVVAQTTVAGNTATGSDLGAGLYLGHDSVVHNSTIAGNQVTSTSAPMGASAGLTLADGAQVTLSSTIVSDNRVGTTPADIGLVSGATSGSLAGDHNLIGTSTLPTPADTLHSNDPGLGPLQNNGGPTETRMPQLGSDAMNNGAANGFATDQRGAGFARVQGMQADIGAVEAYDDTIFADGFDP